MLGLKAKHFPEPEVALCPGNWDAIQLFSRLSTQWRMGAGGPAGLDYTVVHHALERAGIRGDAFDDFMWRIGVIEAEALKCIHEK